MKENGGNKVCGENAECVSTTDGKYYCKCNLGLFGNAQGGGKCSAAISNKQTLITQKLTLPIEYKEELLNSKSGFFRNYKVTIEALLDSVIKVNFEKYDDQSAAILKFSYV